MTGGAGAELGFRVLGDLVDLMFAMGEIESDERNGMSALDHGLQCAFELSRARPADTQLQVAGLVHDIGHLFGNDETHGTLGAARVRRLLGERVAALVEAHVTAKRYLVSSDDMYRSVLSPVSRRTLEAQGDLLSPVQQEEFRSSPHFADAVTLRRADDAAKVPGRHVPGLEEWLPTLEKTAL